jgi:segregation and condensation protein B
LKAYLSLESEGVKFMEQIDQYIEALIFSSEVPITVGEIRDCLESVFNTTFQKEYVETAILRLQMKYNTDAFALEIVHLANGYQFLTKGTYYDVVGVLLKQKSKRKLSKSALETLSIIAYQQPVTKGEIERIRGVGCDYAIQKLLEKELIQIKGRSQDPGRPLLYATSDKFMEHFGLGSIKDLPKLKEFEPNDNEIGLLDLESEASNTKTEDEKEV